MSLENCYLGRLDNFLLPFWIKVSPVTPWYRVISILHCRKWVHCVWITVSVYNFIINFPSAIVVLRTVDCNKPWNCCLCNITLHATKNSLTCWRHSWNIRIITLPVPALYWYLFWAGSSSQINIKFILWSNSVPFLTAHSTPHRKLGQSKHVLVVILNWRDVKASWLRS